MIAARLRLAGATATAALAITACGGGAGADVTKVKETVQRAFAALADGDGPAFCALATSGARAELARTMTSATCAKVVETISLELSTSVKLGLRDVQVGAVTVHGGHATIRNGAIASPRGTLKGFLQASSSPTRLTKQPDGSWKISG